ncbi:SRPBCC domain-containing protein [Arthrobacter sp. MA-N2]|uniref:SRPBCC domain-containing protein n=1 Tax=Arthrobacter sp. MA-N2 TaxID=1101188 RepID=UPI000688A048|nr:SRPBCC domain-containing protein [Arthrobacter sp. MA-N2]
MCTVTELAAEFTVSRSAISQHLLLLEEAGLVAARKEGRNRFYRLDNVGMRELRMLFEQFWTAELDMLVADAQTFTTVDQAFELITQPARLRRWQTVAARVDLRVGGEYRWTVTPGHHAAGTFTEIEPGKRVVFTWAWEQPEAPADNVSTGGDVRQYRSRRADPDSVCRFHRVAVA